MSELSRIRNILALLRAQLWIVPGLISLGFLVLAYWVLTAGASLVDPRGTDLWWLYSGDAGTARDLLASLLSGMMTMTSLVVSVTFVILTLAANQLGPRLISTFMADRQIQAVLGLFLGTILYTLVVLRSLDEALGRGGVPHIAVSVASGLTLLCLVALLFYVHKIARSIIADTVVDRVATRLRQDIRAMLPDEDGRGDGDLLQMPVVQTIAIGRSGYIQTVDYDALTELAEQNDAMLEVEVRAGHFVLEHGSHVTVHASRRLDENFADEVRAAFVTGAERSPAQDLEFAIRQLVEIALRALSPGVNDPFTAIAVTDRLGAALEDVFSRAAQPELLRDEKGVLRVRADRSHVHGLVDAAFDAIRQAAREQPAVLIRTADLLGQLAPVPKRQEAREAVLRQLTKIAETAQAAKLARSDRDDVLGRVEAARALFAGSNATAREVGRAV